MGSDPDPIFKKWSDPDFKTWSDQDPVFKSWLDPDPVFKTWLDPATVLNLVGSGFSKYGRIRISKFVRSGLNIKA